MHLMNDECVFNQASWAHGVNDFKMKLQSGLFFVFEPFQTVIIQNTGRRTSAVQLRSLTSPCPFGT